MNCKNCGAEINAEDKYCEFCGEVINENGKDYNLDGTGVAFVVSQIFSVSNRSIVIGATKQPINVGDTLYKGNKSFCVTNMQCGNSIVTNVDANKSQVGLVFRDFNKKDLKSGDLLTFKKEK